MLGLPVDARRRIAEELLKAYYRAGKVADEKHPFKLSDLFEDVGNRRENAKKRYELRKSLYNEFVKDVASKNHLSREQLNEIWEEAIDKEWIEAPTLPKIYK